MTNRAIRQVLQQTQRELDAFVDALAHHKRNRNIDSFKTLEASALVVYGPFSSNMEVFFDQEVEQPISLWLRSPKYHHESR